MRRQGLRTILIESDLIAERGGIRFGLPQPNRIICDFLQGPETPQHFGSGNEPKSQQSDERQIAGSSGQFFDRGRWRWWRLSLRNFRFRGRRRWRRWRFDGRRRWRLRYSRRRRRRRRSRHYLCRFRLRELQTKHFSRVMPVLYRRRSHCRSLPEIQLTLVCRLQRPDERDHAPRVGVHTGATWKSVKRTLSACSRSIAGVRNSGLPWQDRSP